MTVVLSEKAREFLRGHHFATLAGIAKECGDMDWSALSLDVLENAGLEVPGPSTIQ